MEGAVEEPDTFVNDKCVVPIREGVKGGIIDFEEGGPGTIAEAPDDAVILGEDDGTFVVRFGEKFVVADWVAGEVSPGPFLAVECEDTILEDEEGATVDKGGVTRRAIGREKWAEIARVDGVVEKRLAIVTDKGDFEADTADEPDGSRRFEDGGTKEGERGRGGIELAGDGFFVEVEAFIGMGADAAFRLGKGSPDPTIGTDGGKSEWFGGLNKGCGRGCWRIGGEKG
jgi:hypothetical protein